MTLDEIDRALLELVAKRDEVAFRQLHARYQPRIARFVSRATSRADMIEEITSDTLWTVWKRASSFRGASKVSTWIFGIANHLTYRSIREVGRRFSNDESGWPSPENLHDPWPGSEAAEYLFSALAQLPPAQRAALELAYLLGHSCEEIALRLDCPVNTVKTRLFHGRKKLRRLCSQP